jgi:transposase-like protein
MNTKPEKKAGLACRKYDDEFKRQALQMVRNGRPTRPDCPIATSSTRQ